MNVCTFILKRLVAWGVRRVFGYRGDGINGIFGGFHEVEELELVQVRHEEMAASMACAHAKFTGEVGVCMATSGPGAIHLLDGLYDARMDDQPVVAIVGQSARAAMGGDYQQEVDLQRLFKDVAREYVQTMMVPSQARHLVDRAMRIALAERTVTAVIVPHDLQEEEHSDPPQKHSTIQSGLANWYARDLRIRPGMMASLSGNLAMMGPALPYAIAAKFAWSERPVLALAGDGAMEMNGLAELITVARYWREWKDPRWIALVLDNRDLKQGDVGAAGDGGRSEALRLAGPARRRLRRVRGVAGAGGRPHGPAGGRGGRLGPGARGRSPVPRPRARGPERPAAPAAHHEGAGEGVSRVHPEGRSGARRHARPVVAGGEGRPPPGRGVSMMAISTRPLLAAPAAFFATAAQACPVCHSPLGAEVRAGLFGPELLQNLAATLLPFPLLALVVLLVRRFGLPGVGGGDRP